MAKSLRSKREKRLRAIRREIVSADPITLNKEDAKLAAQEAALAAPKLPVRPQSTTMAMAIEPTPTTSNDRGDSNMDVEMTDDNQSMKSLKPTGKKMKKKIKIAKKKGHGKGKIRKRNV